MIELKKTPLTFREWKAQVMRLCIEVYRKKEVRENTELREEIENLIERLKYARTMDLTVLLFKIHECGKMIPEFLSSLPTEEDIKRWVEQKVRWRKQSQST